MICRSEAGHCDVRNAIPEEVWAPPQQNVELHTNVFTRQVATRLPHYRPVVRFCWGKIATLKILDTNDEMGVEALLQCLISIQEMPATTNGRAITHYRPVVPTRAHSCPPNFVRERLG